MDYSKYSRAKELEAKGVGFKVIYEVVVGSQAYGTNTPESDVDIKGVYIVDDASRIVGDFLPQIELDADTVYYEYGRFLHLLKSANPTVLEMLFAPVDTVLVAHEHIYHVLFVKDQFVTQQCKHSFGGYGFAQVKKAKGLDKKMNYEKHFTEKKTIIDFCYVLDHDNKFATVSFKDWVGGQSESLENSMFGLTAIDHTRGMYAVYYDWQLHYQGRGVRPSVAVEPLGFKGLVNKSTVLTSSVPKYLEPECLLYWNMDAWQEYTKKHKEYLEWLENRNVSRYVDTQRHGQKIDGKNLLHATRLVNVARDIGEGKGMIVRRPEAKYLLKIRKGEVNLEDILKDVTAAIEDLPRVFEKNKSLPYGVEQELITKLILKVYG